MRARRLLVATLGAAAAALVAGLAWQGAPAQAGPASRAEAGVARLWDGQDGVDNTNPATFRVSSFNVLGWSHTAAGGSKARMASGETRMQWTARLLANQAVSVVGMQELQPRQQRTFREIHGSTWDLYPEDTLTRIDGHNSIGWRTADWELAEAHTVAIPYFHGSKVQMPYVLLRHKASGRLVWFVNVHNPATTRKHGNNARWRWYARNLEAALATELYATGLPVVMTGDMNETTPFFCTMTRKAPMKSASGGSYGATKPCSPPRRMKIDWIMGSTDLRFTNYRVNDGTLVDKASDHPMILADVSLSTRARR